MHLKFSPRFMRPAKVSLSLMFTVRVVSRWVHLIRSTRPGRSVISTTSTFLHFSYWHCCWKNANWALTTAQRREKKKKASLPWSVYQLKVELFPTEIRAQTKHNKHIHAKKKKKKCLLHLDVFNHEGVSWMNRIIMMGERTELFWIWVFNLHRLICNSM